jgi:alkylation response protein AidB-like acyl-CoA dehydrogenase
MDAEWWRLDLPSELGGTPAPRALWWALVEMIQGAQAPVFMFGGGPAFAGLLYRLGTPEQQRIRRADDRARLGGEHGADRAGRRFRRRRRDVTKAVAQPDGTWHIEGVKRFITSGEHDLEENIVHFVLARPRAPGPGTKGLSLFLVPKYHFDPETGELGERNGVYATNVEKKMGLKVSTTCELTFGQSEPAVGWLVGEVHDGIAQMFKVIESARMQVGVKAIGTLSTGYLNALDYARTRVQGADLTRAADKTAPRVTINHHPDVRRMLMLQKAYSEGLRAHVHLHRLLARPRAARRGRRGHRGAARSRRASTTCCSRSSRASARSARTNCSPRACRPSAAPATCRTTRSSSTSATRRSTPCTRARPGSRARTSSSGRSSGTRRSPWTPCSARSRPVPDRGRGRGADGKTEARPLAEALVDVRGDGRHA